jgi:hypothetical protein
LAALASPYPFPVTVLPSSLAYTYLKKQPLQPLQIINQKIWPCKKPFFAGKTFPSPKLQQKLIG